MSVLSWGSRLWSPKTLGLVGLLASGAIAAGGTVLLASGRWRVGDDSLTLQIVLFLPWYAFALSVAKFGIDQLVFVAVSADSAFKPTIKRHLIRIAIPCAAVLAVVSSTNYGWVVGSLTFSALVVDVVAASAYSELTARGRYWECSVSGLLNFPLFFLALAVFDLVAVLTIVSAVALFAASSGLRAAWLVICLRRYHGFPHRAVTSSLAIGLQQAGNFWLFRGDQVLLAQERGFVVLQNAGPEFVTPYAFLSRYPEVLSSVMVAVGAVFLPDLYRRLIDVGRGSRVGFGGVAIWGYLLVLLIPWGGYLWLYQSETPIATWYVAPFAVSALLILPANLITYSLLRAGEIAYLNRSLLLAGIMSTILTVPAVVWGGAWWLSILVPVQLGVFVACGVRHVRRA